MRQKEADKGVLMAEGGEKLAKVLHEVCSICKAGVSLTAIDALADKLIRNEGGVASFKSVRDYRWASCVNVNEGVVHGVPRGYRLKDGDILSIDVGMQYKGWHTDMARTFVVGKSQKEKEAFVFAGERALSKAVDVARVGNRIGHISQAIEEEITRAGYSPVRELTGHGVGLKLHEDPMIYCYLNDKIANTRLIKAGMTLAIEVIYARGKSGLVLANDGWTIETRDGSWGGLFEDTIFITEKGPIVLTKTGNFPY